MPLYVIHNTSDNTKIVIEVPYRTDYQDFIRKAFPNIDTTLTDRYVVEELWSHVMEELENASYATYPDKKTHIKGFKKSLLDLLDLLNQAEGMV